MSSIWMLPAGIVVVALVTAVLVLRTVAREAVEVRRSLLELERVAVAVDDLGHEARSIERTWRRVSRQ